VYELKFDGEAIEFLSKLDKALRKRIFNKVISSKPDPFHYFTRLKKRTDYKMQVGN